MVIGTLRQAMQRAETTAPGKVVAIISMDDVAKTIRRINAELVHVQGEEAKLEEDWVRITKEHEDLINDIVRRRSEIEARLATEQEKLAVMVREHGIRAEVVRR